MADLILMPQMGYDMREGRLVRWLKVEGDAISRGEEIAEIETDKAVIPMPSTAAGVLRKIIAEEGSTIPVGETMGIIGEKDEAISLESSPQPTSGTQKESVATDSPKSSTPKKEEAPKGEFRASPIAKRIAIEKGIDLSTIRGSGPGGRITEQDVLSAGDLPSDNQQSVTTNSPEDPISPTPTVEERVPLSRMRQAIARLTSRSKQEIPHFYVTAEINMEATLSVRQQLNSKLGESGGRVSINDFIVKACAIALGQPQFSGFNSSFIDNSLDIHPNINIGVAIDLEGKGLMVPAIMRCQNLSLTQIATASKDLVERAKTDKLQVEEYSESTFSVSNLGMFDVESFTAIIHPPNSAVLAVGTVKERPVVVEKSLTIARTMFATLAVDHRVSDGASGARFLVEVKRLLESPVNLL